jgi:hypothetical protein
MRAAVAALALLLMPSLVHARQHRSWEAKHEFEIETGHPHGWPGHVVDHVIPLACGGPDAPSNMQWESAAEGKAKDRWERYECRIINGRGEGCCK